MQIRIQYILATYIDEIFRRRSFQATMRFALEASSDPSVALSHMIFRQPSGCSLAAPSTVGFKHPTAPAGPRIRLRSRGFRRLLSRVAADTPRIARQQDDHP